MKTNDVKEIRKRLEAIDLTLANMDKTLALNTQSLIEHMKRTERLEKEFAPVLKHVEQVRGAGKLIFFLSLLATIMMVVEIFK